MTNTDQDSLRENRLLIFMIQARHHHIKDDGKYSHVHNGMQISQVVQWTGDEETRHTCKDPIQEMFDPEMDLNRPCA